MSQFFGSWYFAFLDGLLLNQKFLIFRRLKKTHSKAEQQTFLSDLQWQRGSRLFRIKALSGPFTAWTEHLGQLDELFGCHWPPLLCVLGTRDHSTVHCGHQVLPILGFIPVLGSTFVPDTTKLCLIAGSLCTAFHPKKSKCSKMN